MWSGCYILGYADDTHVVTTARSAEMAAVKANMQTAIVIHKIQRLGLCVAADKTEAVLFHGRRRPLHFPVIRVGDTYIQTGNTLKYLGVMLDSRLDFGEHFKFVASKASKVA